MIKRDAVALVWSVLSALLVALAFTVLGVAVLHYRSPSEQETLVIIRFQFRGHDFVECIHSGGRRIRHSSRCRHCVEERHKYEP